MNIKLIKLLVRTRKSTEIVDFKSVSFIYGPISKGKSSVARLVDYCLGGKLERTPAIQQEFVTAELSLILGGYECLFERSSDDKESVRVTWVSPSKGVESAVAPLTEKAGSKPLVGNDIYTLSDLIFFLCGVEPIKVRKRRRDPDSPLIRLGIRDIWRYCYLDQTHLDSSHFSLEDPFRGRKSQDAMRFFTGLHSERLNSLDVELMGRVDEQRSKREAVKQIWQFLEKFDLQPGQDALNQLVSCQKELNNLKTRRNELERERFSLKDHPTESLRSFLRKLGAEIEQSHLAILDCKESLSEQVALRSELIASKTKAIRNIKASTVLDLVEYAQCPECGLDISNRPKVEGRCRVCGGKHLEDESSSTTEIEVLRRDINDRVDQLGDSINLKKVELGRMQRQLTQKLEQKSILDRKLEEKIEKYDSAYVEQVRVIDADIGRLEERKTSIGKLVKMSDSLIELEEEVGALQGVIDSLRSSIKREQNRLMMADNHINAIATEFKEVMLSVSFPGVSENDEVRIDPRNWKPEVIHFDQPWNFWDAGSGGKKTLFNVCYAVAIHRAAIQNGMPVPDLLIIDSPTKNISEDENPELVQSLYNEIYRVAAEEWRGRKLQLLLIDSDLVVPKFDLKGFSIRRMSGEPESPSLISYYDGP